MGLYRPVLVGAKRPLPAQVVCVRVLLFIKPTILSSESGVHGVGVVNLCLV